MRVQGQESRVESQSAHVGEFLRNSRSRLGETRLRALTLIELLVVIVILTTLVAAAIPLMSPANDGRRLREASRGLNTFITGAQTRAIALKRPFGIALKRLSQDTGSAEDNGVCLEVFYAEQPVPYAGFDSSSRARLAFYNPSNTNLYGGLRPLVLVQFVTRGNGMAMSNDGLPTGWDPDLFPTGMIRPGDVVDINGTHYRLLADPSDSTVEATFDSTGNFFNSNTGRSGANKAPQIVAYPINDTGQLVNVTHDDRGNEIGSPDAQFVPFFTYPAPYKILRQAAPTSDEPYQLPEGTAIDLRASGVGSGDFFYWPGMNDNSQGIIVLFTPEGRVARVSYSQASNAAGDNDPPFDQPVADNLYLLLGKRENIPAPLLNSDPTLSASEWSMASTEEARAKLREPINWLNGNCRWLVIGSQSGRVVTVENGFVDPLTVLGDPVQPFTMASEKTEMMRAAQILAAREFTREMVNEGGR